MSYMPPRVGKWRKETTCLGTSYTNLVKPKVAGGSKVKSGAPPSVRPSVVPVRPSVCPSVRPSVRHGPVFPSSVFPRPIPSAPVR
eukprot:1422198-Prymnesium_polylepis.1